MNMNYKKLADLLGITPSRLSNILAGRANVSPVAAARFEELTGIAACSWLSLSPAVRAQAVLEFIYRGGSLHP